MLAIRCYARFASAGLQNAGNGDGKKKSFKVQLACKPLGYGILLDGARSGAEGNKIGAGVFIADILPKSDAAQYKVGTPAKGRRWGRWGDWGGAGVGAGLGWGWCWGRSWGCR